VLAFVCLQQESSSDLFYRHQNLTNNLPLRTSLQ